MISVIIPFINEKKYLPGLIDQLRPILDLGHEIILVDGGGTDNFSKKNADDGITLYYSDKGRSKQMNLGASRAEGDILWFLHADSRLEQPVMDYIDGMDEADLSWGRFNVKLSGKKYIFNVISMMMNMRSSFTGIATGDQGIFVDRELFKLVGGYNDIEIMEDINICKKLKRITAPLNFKLIILTSSRRWQDKGIIKTILLMWVMRILYFIGVSPSLLIKFYEK